MLTFKTSYLQEEASYNKSIGYLLAMGHIPLNKEVLATLGHNEDSMIVYHATSLDFLPGMKKLGTTKKQISTFTSGLGSIMGSISVKPEVLCKLEGVANLVSNHDIFSHPDPKGLRWISSRGTKKSNFFLEAILNRTIKELDRLGKFNFTKETKEDLVYDEVKFEDYFGNLTSANQKKLIKFYKKTLVDLLKNKMYLDILKEILGKQKTTGTHNEIIMSKFKVLGVYSLEGGRYLYSNAMAKDQIEAMGYKYLGHISKDEFASTKL